MDLHEINQEGNMPYSVDEAQTKLYSALAEELGFKYLKSQRCLKKVVNNLIFEFDFYSSKWNKSGEKVDIEAAFVIMNKKYGKQRIDCMVAEKMYRPGQRVDTGTIYQRKKAWRTHIIFCWKNLKQQ